MAGDGNDWAIADDARQIARVAARLGAQVGSESWVSAVRDQSVFHASQFALLGQPFERNGNRLGVAYLHGRPGTKGMPEFDTCYEAVRTRHEELDRIQVPSRAMEELVLEAGVPAEKVFRIPIGIDLERFTLRTPAERAEARAKLGLPEDAFVAGSFQKDGVGWEEGLEPKLIKGPDVLLDAVERLRTARARSCGCCSRRPRAATSSRAWTGSASRTSTCSSTDRTGWPRRTARSTSASSPRATRVGRRPCWRRWRPASRS